MKAASAQAMLASATVLFEYLTTAVSLSRDRALVRSLRALAGAANEEVFLAFGAKGPFVHLAGERVVGSSIELPSQLLGPVADIVDLPSLLTDRPAAREALFDAHERTDAMSVVAAWLRSFASGADTMTRETFRAIAAWQALVAIEAYRQLTHASTALDGQRRGLLDEVARGGPSPHALQAYWALVHMIGNGALLATMGEETAWLGGLVASVPPGRWTPSFVLVRERCMRLGVRAGWAAAGFGEAAVARYLSVLESAPAPLHAFDAVLGLTAIGVRHASLARSIRREIETTLTTATASSPPPQRALFEALHRSAELVLDDPSRAARWTNDRAARVAAEQAALGPVRRGAIVVDGDEDCAELEEGIFPCIAALAVVVHAPAEALFPAAADPIASASTEQRAREVLLRTGTSTKSEPSRTWVH